MRPDNLEICEVCKLDINEFFEGIRFRKEYCDTCKDIIEEYETQKGYKAE